MKEKDAIIQLDKGVKKMKQLAEWIFAVAIGIAIAVLLRFFVVEGYRVSGESMMPTFQHGDYVFAEKVSYKVGELAYGDIVILETDTEEGKKIIKRVMGLSGDHIAVQDGVVYRNGEMVEETYTKEATLEDFEEYVIPEDGIFVLGDNRNNSLDSRYFGAFTYDQVKGRVAFELLNDPFTFY